MIEVQVCHKACAENQRRAGAGRIDFLPALMVYVPGKEEPERVFMVEIPGVVLVGPHHRGNRYGVRVYFAEGQGLVLTGQKAGECPAKENSLPAEQPSR